MEVGRRVSCWMRNGVCGAVLVGALWAQTSTPAESFEDLSRRAQSLIDRDPAQAATLYQQALEQRPDWAEGWFYLGGALHQLGRYKEAVDAFHKVLDLGPKNGVAWGFLSLSEYE